MKASWLAVGMAAAALSSSACLVQIAHVQDPEPIFQEARREAARYAGRPGPARRLNVLVWSPDDRELVRVSVPMWLVRQAAKRADWDEIDLEDDGQGEVKAILKRRLRLEDIEQAGLGTLVEVEEEEGEQVLVWLR